MTNALEFLRKMFEAVNVFLHQKLAQTQITYDQQVILIACVTFLLMVLAVRFFTGIFKVLVVLVLVLFEVHILVPGFGV